MRTVSETSGTLSTILESLLVVPEEHNKRKGYEKIFEEIIVKNFPKMGNEITTKVQEAQRVPIQDKP